MNEIVKNKKGIKIRRICASCRYKDQLGDTYRKCLKRGCRCTPLEVCEQWEIKEKYDEAGKGDGVVKSLKKMVAHQVNYLAALNKPNLLAYWKKRLEELEGCVE